MLPHLHFSSGANAPFLCKLALRITQDQWNPSCLTCNNLKSGLASGLKPAFLSRAHETLHSISTHLSRTSGSPGSPVLPRSHAILLATPQTSLNLEPPHLCKYCSFCPDSLSLLISLANPPLRGCNSSATASMKPSLPTPSSAELTFLFFLPIPIVLYIE